MEEYTEAKTYKRKQKLRNSQVLTILIHQSRKNIIASHTEFYDKPQINRNVSANVAHVSWYVCFQLRILDVTQAFALKLVIVITKAACPRFISFLLIENNNIERMN